MQTILHLKYNLLKNTIICFTQMRTFSYSNVIQYLAIQGEFSSYFCCNAL